jgi:hypothetical protein
MLRVSSVRFAVAIEHVSLRYRRDVQRNIAARQKSFQLDLGFRQPKPALIEPTCAFSRSPPKFRLPS